MAETSDHAVPRGSANISQGTVKIRQVFNSFLRIRESWLGSIGACVVAFWLLIAFLAPWIAPYDPNLPIQPNLLLWSRFDNGTMAWLGTDHLGRDMLSRIIWGARTALFWATAATVTAYAVGTVEGLIAGYKRGIADTIISSVSNLILAFPVLVIYLIVIVTIGASGINIVIAIVFASSPGIMRIVRGLTLDAREREYIAAAQIQGKSEWEIMFIDILPNVISPLIVDFCLRIGYVIITIGVLGFLGLGLPPPDPDWGSMINASRQLAFVYPHMTVLPAVAVSSLVLGLSFLADGIRDMVNRD